MAATSSLVLRAGLALTLMLGFYVLAVGFGGFLLWVPVAEWTYLDRLDIRLAALCLGGGASILWSLRPRVDHFEPPGPRVHLERHPRLAALVSEVAAATKQAEPEEVYLVPQVNAFVTQRGGMMGFGSKRVMGLGLPLMAVLNVEEFKAVLAHEFGHYHGGDVALGPLVYRTRGAIGRTLAATHGTIFNFPFTGYAKLFLRTSSAVSRHQELVADALAAAAVSPLALAGGLQQAEIAGSTFGAYLAAELSPVLNAGYVPDIGAGFRAFVREVRPHSADQPGAGQGADAYDSHPPLEERLAAIGVTSLARDEGEPATSLLTRLPELEHEVFRLGGAPKPLEPIDWRVVPERVYLPSWRAAASTHAELLKGIELDQLPTSPAKVLPYARNLKGDREGLLPHEEIASRFVGVVGGALAARLADEGWTLDTAPGRGITFTHGADVIEPFNRISAVVFGREPLSAWAETCRRLGLRVHE